MISIHIVRANYNPDRATERAPIYLAVAARFPKVAFSGEIHVDDILGATMAPKPSDYFGKTKLTDLDGRFWSNQQRFWEDIDEEAIRLTLCDVVAIFLDQDAVECAKTEWLCNHPANRALATRVMAGLAAGL